LLAARARGLLRQPAHERAAVAPATAVGARHEVVDVEVAAPGEVLLHAEARDGRGLLLAGLERAGDAVGGRGLPVGGLRDRFGRRRALTAGLLVFGTGSVLAALAGTTGALIASRALMGVGGALIMPSTLSILTAVFPAEERAKAIGAWAAVAGLGIALGP